MLKGLAKLRNRLRHGRRPSVLTQAPSVLKGGYSPMKRRIVLHIGIGVHVPRRRLCSSFISIAKFLVSVSENNARFEKFRGTCRHISSTKLLCL
jgi:hypothetical protein